MNMKSSELAGPEPEVHAYCVPGALQVGASRSCLACVCLVLFCAAFMPHLAHTVLRSVVSLCRPETSRCSLLGLLGFDVETL